MKRQRIDRSETAIPCMIMFTKPLLIAGLPRNLYYSLLAAALFLTVLFKNLIAALIVVFIYILLRYLNYKDETTVEGLWKMNKKKYISY
ncbi:MAG: hypothetical protein SOV59_08445 [Fusobacterium mortiferum]|nr:hypothetical protein [Fusobacterium mortiferum]